MKVNYKREYSSLLPIASKQRSKQWKASSERVRARKPCYHCLSTDIVPRCPCCYGSSYLLQWHRPESMLSLVVAQQQPFICSCNTMLGTNHRRTYTKTKLTQRRTRTQKTETEIDTPPPLATGESFWRQFRLYIALYAPPICTISPSL